MSETLITCPTCKTEFPLTESLAAPLVESTRREYEQKIAQKESDVSKREKAIAEERESLDEKLAAQLKTEREKIAAEESKKARRTVSLVGNRTVSLATQLTAVESSISLTRASFATFASYRTRSKTTRRAS